MSRFRYWLCVRADRGFGFSEGASGRACAVRVATCRVRAQAARVASLGAMKISGLTLIVACQRAISLSPNAGRSALGEPIVGVPRVTHPAGRVGSGY